MGLGRGFLAVALLLTTCTASVQKLPPGARYGGTLRIASVRWADFQKTIETAAGTYETALDPGLGINALANEFFRCCLLRTLMSYNGRPTESGGTVLRPDIAVGPPETSADGISWTFRIRKGLRYAPPLERVEITARDFIRAIERNLVRVPDDLAEALFLPLDARIDQRWQDIIEGAAAYAAGDASTISGLEAPDAHTLRVRLIRPNSELGYLFSLPGSAPIPPDPADPSERLGTAQGHDGTYGVHLVSSGPYMLEGSADLNFAIPPDEQAPVAGYVRGERFALVRNPSWRRATDSLRPAYPDRIELSIFAEDSETVRRVEQEEFDLAYDAVLDAETIRRYQARPDLARRLLTHANDVVFLVGINIAAPPFDDLHVRRAVNFAANKARFPSLAAAAGLSFLGPLGGQVAGHFVPDGLEGDLLLAYDPYETPGRAGSVTAAKSEMAASAADRNRDGVCDADECSDVRVLVRKDNPFWHGVAEELRRNLAPIGIYLRITLVDHPVLFAEMVDPLAHTPMGIGFAFLKEFPTPSTFFADTLLSASIVDGFNWSLTGATPSQLEEWGYPTRSVPSVDNRIAACRARIEGQTRCWAELDQYVMERVVPAIPFLFGSSFWIMSERVTASSFDQLYDFPALDRFALRAD